ncbi:ubiquitin fusion degradation protein [Scheffersomyces xylosifermentans]|uniref:ubiquitin fusion degradation protein n=1 Tax=Scheffersomyces xylosifermentans TaxID=1304137 RepID=UPI00315D115B
MMQVAEFRLKVSREVVSLPSYSDKAILPSSVLSQIVDVIPESDLPHPLIFKITNNESLESTYIGVKEFSSPEENTVILPNCIFTKLNEPETVSIRLVRTMAKAMALKVKPLQLYSNITNWKFFLENKLTKFYTTLTNKEHLVIEDDNLRYELFIDEINDEAHKTITACIVDTDVILDVVPLNDKLASEQLLEFNSNPHNNIVEIEDSLLLENVSSFLNPKFVPRIYKIDLTKYDKEIQINLQNLDFTSNNYDTVFNVDLIAGLDKLTTLENFKYTTMGQDFKIQNNLDHGISTDGAKSFTVDLRDDEIVNKLNRAKEVAIEGGEEPEKYLYLIPFTWDSDAKLKISITTDITSVHDIEDEIEMIPEGYTRCSNCLKSISSNKLVLHESFCLRNNVRCTQCNSVFLKSIPQSHWHCDQGDNFYTDSNLLKFKHIRLYHTNQAYKCNQCGSPTVYDSFLDLVTKHKATDCPQKLHQCRFCHLIVPQGEYTYQDRFENLTNHENSCGNKTVECYKCNKIFRTKDFQKHLKMHDLDKIQFNQWNKTTFRKCSNENCINLLKNDLNDLGLCDLCYGPLYIAQNDPTNIKLQSRIERKYMMQLTKGCGNSWCNNQYCLSSNNVSSEIKGKPFKELIAFLNGYLFKQIARPSLPINKSYSNGGQGNSVWFCVNESISTRKILLDLIRAEGEYDEEIIYKAVNERTNEEGIRSWLGENAVKVRDC